MFAALYSSDRKEKIKKNHLIITYILNVQMSDKVLNHLCCLTLAYGNTFLGNNPFLPDQCYHYAIIFLDYIMNSLTFPISAKRDTPH